MTLREIPRPSARDVLHGGPDRRCLSASEMTEKGMAVSARGLWVTELNTSPRDFSKPAADSVAAI